MFSFKAAIQVPNQEVRLLMLLGFSPRQQLSFLINQGGREEREAD